MTKEGARQLESEIRDIEKQFERTLRHFNRRANKKNEPLVSSYTIVTSPGDTLGDLGAGLEVKNGRN